MNIFCTLEDDIIPSEAIRKFLLDPPLLVVYLWAERKYIKFWLSQRWAFEEVMSSLQIVACASRFLRAKR
jgi:hypothetical protein